MMVTRYLDWLACTIYSICRVSRSSPAAPVLAGPVFLKVKMKFNFYIKQVINKIADVIFGLEL